VHIYLDTEDAPRVDKDGETYSIVGRIVALQSANSVEAAGIMLEAVAKPELLTMIQPCKDCGALQGELCKPGCTQESYQ
jgi:hypothetical protein